MNDRSRDRGDDRGDRGRDRGDDRGRERGRDRGDDRGRDRDRGRDDPPSRERESSRSTREAYSRDDRGGRDSGRDRGGRDDRGGSGSSSSFQYRRREATGLERRAKMGNTEFDKILKDGVPMWTPADGSNIVRILPATWEPEPGKELHFGVDVHVHYGIGPDRQSYLCRAKHLGEACPICEERALVLKDGDDEYAKELDTRRRVLVYMIDRDDEKEGLQVWAMPQSVDQDLAKVGVDKRTRAVLDIDDPERGYDVEFDKEGKGKNTKYKGLMIARDSSPLGDMRWLDEAVDNPLPTLLNFHDYDHIAAVFGGAGGGGRRDDRNADDRGRRDDPRDSRDDRGHSGSGRDRGGESRDDRGGRDVRGGRDDRGGDSSSRRPAEPDLSWDEVHKMESHELDRLAETHPDCSRIDPQTFKSDEELADALCAAIGIKEPRAADSGGDGGGRRRLSELRGGR